jgi:lambda family phage portal protein
MSALDWIRSKFVKSAQPALPPAPSEDDFKRAQSGPQYMRMLQQAVASHYFDGSKFPQGFTDPGRWGIELIPDLCALRTSSHNFYLSNHYARGLIDRLVTNEVHTGLMPEADPVQFLTGQTEAQALDWSEDVETRFSLWAEATPSVSDHAGMVVFGDQQAQVRLESLLGGDCVVAFRQSAATGLPTLELIPGNAVVSPPLQDRTNGREVIDGVERDETGRHTAYYVSVQRPGELRPGVERLPTTVAGGRTNAIMVYGTSRRAGTVRGVPLLGLMLQSLDEIGKFRDSVQRKAFVSSLISIFITRDLPGAVGSDPMRNAARSLVESTGSQEGARTETLVEHQPGIILDSLNAGEKPHFGSSEGTDEKFGEFEAAILNSIAWAIGMPPSILRLSFSSNYAASQAENNEFEIWLGLSRVRFARQFLRYVYREWLISEVLKGNVPAPSLVAALDDPAQFDVVAAWMWADWSGAVKPTADPVKMAKALELLTDGGFITRARGTRNLGNGKYSNVVRQLEAENAELQKARAALAGPQQEAADDDDDTGDDDDDNGSSNPTE